jgi:hypothetical protein
VGSGACRTVNDVGEPCAGEPHARFDGRALETGWLRSAICGSRVGALRDATTMTLVGSQPIDQPQPRQRSTLLPSLGQVCFVIQTPHAMRAGLGHVGKSYPDPVGSIWWAGEWRYARAELRRPHGTCQIRDTVALNLDRPPHDGGRRRDA